LVEKKPTKRQKKAESKLSALASGTTTTAQTPHSCSQYYYIILDIHNDSLRLISYYANGALFSFQKYYNNKKKKQIAARTKQGYEPPAIRAQRRTKQETLCELAKSGWENGANQQQISV